MVTRNEVIRGDLLLASLNQAVVTINNNIDILNNQLTVALGLPENEQIIPVDDTLQLDTTLQDYGVYKEEATTNHPLIKSIDIQTSRKLSSHSNSRAIVSTPQKSLKSLPL